MTSPACPRLVVLLFTLIFSASPAPADELQDIRSLLKQASTLSLERVNRYLAQNPSDAQARFKKDWSSPSKIRLRSDRGFCSSFRRTTPSCPSLITSRVLYARRSVRKGPAAAGNVHPHGPALATAYENLGDVYTKLASQAYDKALQLDSSNSAAKTSSR